MKTIIALWHVANKGKTETLRNLAKLFVERFAEISYPFEEFRNIPSTGDFRFIIEINGKIIGIETQGDPTTELEDRLIDLVEKYNCDIIFCATRTKGETIYAVDNLFYNHGFKTIWTSTYQVADITEQNLLNRLKAQQLLEVLTLLNIL